MEHVRILTNNEVKTLSQTGITLDTTGKKYYALLGLFNDKMNQAAEPGPFRIYGASMKEIAETFVGKPLLWNPDPNHHFRANQSKDAKIEASAILTQQRKYTIGEMVAPIINETSKNAYGVFEIWPEYVSAIETSQVPEFVSPLMLVEKEDIEGIKKAQGIHLQFVGEPGYPRKLAKLHGTCMGGIEQCMKELRILGASGKLREYQKSFSNTITGNNGNMDATPAEERISAVEDHMKSFDSKLNEISDSIKKIVGATGSSQTGVVVTDIKTNVPAGVQPPTIDPKIAELEKQVKEMKDAKEKAEADSAEQLKKFQEAQTNKTIENIISLEQKLHDISSKEVSDRTKFYTEMSKTAGLPGLELVEKTLSKRSEKIVGAAGDRELIVLDGSQTSRRSSLALHTAVRSL